MGFIDIEELLGPISPSEPAGPNLEYDPEFLALEQSAAGTPEQQIGSHVSPAEPPDHKLVLKQATELLGRTKDLRVIVFATRALLNLEGIAGLQEGLGLLHGVLAQYWAHVHPELDAEDDNDPTMRLSAMSGLVAPEFLMEVRNVPLLRSRTFGNIGLRHLLATGSEDGGSGVDVASVEAAFREVPAAELEQLTGQLELCLERWAAAEAVFEANGVSGMDWSALRRVLRQAKGAVEKRIPSDEQPSGAALSDESASSQWLESASPAEARPASAANAVGSRGLAIQSRADVVRCLDLICGYYAQHEPSSPLPLLLERCKRLVDMTFLDIVRDLAPDGVSQVETLAGKVADE